MIWVDFCGNFPWFWLIFFSRIRFNESDPDPTDQNKTNPDPQHWLTEWKTYPVHNSIGVRGFTDQGVGVVGLAVQLNHRRRLQMQLFETP